MCRNDNIKFNIFVEFIQFIIWNEGIFVRNNFFFFI